MIRPVSIMVALVLGFSLVGPITALASTNQSTIPTITIISVVIDSKVSVRTHNFPAYDSFNVRMGKMGTRGVNGIKVATIYTGNGLSTTYDFNIPSALKGNRQIAIRFESNTGSDYYAYNWFPNRSFGWHPDGPWIYGYKDIPSFSIKSVVRDQTVTVVTYNFPSKDQFQVTMGPMGTRGKYGYIISTINSGSGGSQTFTFNIPAPLKGSYQISIRFQSVSGSRYYAYNWFFNKTTP